jgi:hypothetical protein
MAVEEAVDLRCPFAGQDRADGIDEASARADQFGGNVEPPLLQREPTVETLRRETPAALGIAPPRPAARAGRVNEDHVRLLTRVF